MLVEIVRKTELKNHDLIPSNEILFIHKDIFLNEYENNKEELTHLLYTAVNYIYSYCFKKNDIMPISKELPDIIKKVITEDENIKGIILFATVINFNDSESKEKKEQPVVSYTPIRDSDFENGSYLREMYGDN